MIPTRSILAFAVVALLAPAACAVASSSDDEAPDGGGGGASGPDSTAGGSSGSGGGASSSSGASEAGGQGSSSGGGQPGDGGATHVGDASSEAGSADATGGGRPDAGTTARDASTADTGRADTGAARDATTGPTDSGAGGTDGCAGPVATLAGALATGITFVDTAGQPVNAHGGGIIQVGRTFYMHGEFFLSTTTNNDFNGFSMYSSTDLATWKNEGIILPQQPSGQLGPARKGERPHIIQCPATGEFVLYAHAASEDYQTDKEVVYATSATVNGQYAFKGNLTNASGVIAAHSDMSAYADSTGAYVLTESGDVYTLSSDCHSWLTDQTFNAVNGDSGGSESPTVFKAGSTYYWIGSYKTGWRANNNFYSTAPAVTGPWTFQGFVAPVTDPTNDISDQRTWLTQSTWVQPITGCAGTTYVYWGDHWYGNQDTTAPGLHNNLATYVFQPLVFTGNKISLPTYLASWTLDVGEGTVLP